MRNAETATMIRALGMVLITSEIRKIMWQGLKMTVSRKMIVPIQSGTTFCGMLMVKEPSALNVIEL